LDLGSIVIIVVLRRQAKREVRMEEYAKSQAESMQRMANKSPIINVSANAKILDKDNDDNQEQKELGENEFWVYDKQGRPLMKIAKEDKYEKPKLRSITDNLKLDADTGNVKETVYDTDNGNNNNTTK
jgi:hypothetical protein